MSEHQGTTENPPGLRAQLAVLVESTNVQRGIVALILVGHGWRFFRSAWNLFDFVVESLGRSLPGLGSIGLLLLIFFYVFAVMATKLYGAEFPQWFGSLWGSMFSLFQIMTLEGWADIAREVMASRPAAWLFFFVFILMATFTVLNLFIAVIVNAMQEPETPVQHEPVATPA